jgi:hypothetical protein
MNRPSLSLQPSEAIVAESASVIYAAYIASGRVPEGAEQKWIDRSVHEAIQIARQTDEAIHSDTEMH